MTEETKPYIIEADWITSAGFRAVVVKHNLGYSRHRCGYVGVEDGHPLFGVDYNKLNIDAHGGITYANSYSSYPVESKLWWFGFDTARCFDMPEIGGQTLAFCKAECEKIAFQLKEN